MPLSKVVEVQQLLSAGDLSRRKIAKQVGISRGVVNAIANGTRGIFGREPTEDPATLAPCRCAQCGELVYPPCVACRAREYRSRQIAQRRRAA